VVIGGGWYQLSRFETRLQNDYSRTIATPDHEGFQASMSDYMYDVDPSPFVGNDRDEDGYGWGYLAQEAFDNDIPSKPALSYTGVAGFSALLNPGMAPVYPSRENGKRGIDSAMVARISSFRSGRGPPFITLIMTIFFHGRSLRMGADTP